ncbi:prenyltransferase [Microbacterium paludicola]|uniref:Prenyltransferase n=1 Tax=Microbacterium paludicola TaxID=300019 RepID=A0A4Y9FRE3_9MICO|nr:prenyltransferase [Microbacterium paludicola]MBF0817391.1 prenyltransferase [Microbacterium paludicola]TFU31442.1 prenyltransferase [Microbacterium paludicola]
MIGDLFAASRPLSWINTAYPFAAAYLLASREVDVVLIVGTLFFLVPYNLAMYGVNDVFDYASDLANPRKGGVEGALLPPERHRGVLIASALACLPFVVLLVVWGTPLSWLVLAVSLFAVVAYSAPPFRFKELPVLDSVTSSVHFVSPAAYGVVIGGGVFDAPLVAVLLAFFLWGLASHAFGAVQDVVPDRQAGIVSIATALGAARTVALALAAWTAAGLLMLSTGQPGAWAALLAIPYLLAAAPYARVSDADSARANRGWRHFLWINYACGFVVTVLLIVHALRTA